MVDDECKKKLALIQQVILLDNQFSELIARFFSERYKQDLLNKTIIQEMSISKKREIIKSIFKHQEVENISEWCRCAVICIQIRNAVAHNLPQEDCYNLNINGKNKDYKVDELLKIFKKAWKEVNPPILSILDKLKDDNIKGDVVLVRIYMRNYKMWFNDIYSVQIENSEGEEKEFDDYPDNQYSIEEYEEEVKWDIKDWLTKRGINMTNAEIEVYLDWYEEPDS